jgi:hypothetical protein
MPTVLPPIALLLFIGNHQGESLPTYNFGVERYLDNLTVLFQVPGVHNAIVDELICVRRKHLKNVSSVTTARSKTRRRPVRTPCVRERNAATIVKRQLYEFSYWLFYLRICNSIEHLCVWFDQLPVCMSCLRG